MQFTLNIPILCAIPLAPLVGSMIAGIILLVAIIAAVALTLRNRKDSKSQNIHEQVNVVAADRMRIVKMDSDMAAKQDSRGEKK